MQPVELAGVHRQVAAEPAARVVDPAGARQLHQVGRLVLGQVARGHELEPDGGRRHALLEVGAREAVPVVEELDHEVVPRYVLELGVFHLGFRRPHGEGW